MLKKNKKEILAIIPARAGSKRIKNKNIKIFCGKPLLAYSVLQAKDHPLIGRIIVDTDSPKIAAIARKYGAEVPYLRPKHLAGDKAQVKDAIIHLMRFLKKSEGYRPDYIMILQTTSPLREPEDITHSWKAIGRGATSTITLAPTSPVLFHIGKDGFLKIANSAIKTSSNSQAWPDGHKVNGGVYIIKTDAFLKEKSVFTKKTIGVICPVWRSVDIDTPEEWAMAEILYKNRRKIVKRIKNP